MAFIFKKPSVKKAFLALALCTPLLACTPLGQLKKAAEYDRGDFYSSLAVEYLAFATSEGELGYKDTRDFFASKGLKASKREAVPPETPEAWEITGGLSEELRNARGRLMDVRNEFLQRVASQNVARTQMLFDCWVMQAAKDRDDDLTLPCRQEFLSELRTLEQVVDTLGPAPEVILPAHYSVQFPFDSSKLTRDGKYAVNQVLALTTLYPDYRIEVTGYADRAGSMEYNIALSRARAEVVHEALRTGGIDAARITVNAKGEADPKVPTLDGIVRSRNRRVEIWILPLTEEDEPIIEEEDS